MPTLTYANIGRPAIAFSEQDLFASGEPGLWPGPSDLSTLFQDTAGTVPVTTPGQTVGRAGDKSGRGNHLIQPVALSRPTLGRHPVGGRRNLLTYTEDFSNAIWVVGSTGVTKSAPDLVLTSPSSDRRYAMIHNKLSPTVSGQSYLITGTFIPKSGGEVISLGSSASGAIFGWVAYDTITGTSSNYSLGGPYTSISLLSAVQASPGVWRMSVLIVSNGVSVRPLVHFGATGQTAEQLRFEGNGAGSIGLTSMQFVPGSDPGAYQRVTSDWDVTEAGKADCWYLGFDGIDDFMVTAATLDLSATDKVTIFAGVKKFTDAATGIVAEFSGNVSLNEGTFYLVNGDGSGNSRPWSTSSRGTAAATASVAAYDTTVAPDAAVLTATHDIAGDLSTIRRNGVAGVAGTGDKGAGNFGSYLLYVGRRGGTTLPARCDLYGLTLVGRQVSTLETQGVEALIASKMGITL